MPSDKPIRASSSRARFPSVEGSGLQLAIICDSAHGGSRLHHPTSLRLTVVDWFNSTQGTDAFSSRTSGRGRQLRVLHWMLERSRPTIYKRSGKSSTSPCASATIGADATRAKSYPCTRACRLQGTVEAVQNSVPGFQTSRSTLHAFPNSVFKMRDWDGY